MQIQRFEHDPHVLAESTTSRKSGAARIGWQGPRPAREGETVADWNLSPLLAHLRQFPETRADAVEAARQKLGSGEYLTSHAAERLADSSLRNDIFSSRP